MIESVRTILESFDELPDPEKHEAASAILRRALRLDAPLLTDDDLMAQADDVFRHLDTGEASDEQSQPRGCLDR